MDDPDRVNLLLGGSECSCFVRVVAFPFLLEIFLFEYLMINE